MADGGSEKAAPEVSVVLPCLDEAETLAACIQEARTALREAGLTGEVIVADNGSSDGSQAVAEESGARVVHVTARGYGSALRGGILASRGTYVVMADADGSYDFGAVPAFVERLRAGYDLVMGNRFRGGIEPGAMPALHRWLGNPVLSFLGRLFFNSSVGDFHCGIRGFRRDAYGRLGLTTSGMEFASEMIIMASLRDLEVTEIPATLRRDGRTRRPHLRTWRDGWRHLRFMLLYSPRWLFLLPSLAMLLLGFGGLAALEGGPRTLGAVTIDIHTMLMSGMSAILGYQVLIFGVFTRAFATREGLYPGSQWLRALHRSGTLELGLLAGLGITVLGATVIVSTAFGWQRTGFDHLDPRVTMRQLIPATVLLVIGTQTIFSSFFLGILGIQRAGGVELAAVPSDD